MFSTLASAALLGISAVAAMPQGNYGGHGGPPGYHSSSTSTATSTATAASSGQTAFSFPLANGFPNIKVPSAALTAIELQAHGTLPNGPLPNKLAPGDVTSFQLIAFNELFEVAFFTSLIQNITNDVSGFEVPSPAIKNFVLQSLTAIQAQEELHALGANGILASAGATTIQPCKYKFPSNTFDTAINFARTFTDVVLGTLQDAQNGLGVNGDTELIALLGSVIGQEGEQNGYYRSLLDLIPSELPFLTRSTGPWAFSVLNQNVIVPGSCPNENVIDLPIFGALTVDTQNIQPKSQELQFTFKNNGTNTNDISLVYVNQQNLPVVEKPSNIQVSGDEVTFQAYFPFNEFIMNGLTFAVVTDSAGPFASADAVAAATLFGPGLIEIN